jgi:enoyl-CoA hydratase
MLLRTELHDRVAVLTLDDDQRRNALSRELVDELVACFDTLERDDVGAVVITGAGAAFCSGAVLDDLAQMNGEAAEAHLRSIYEGFLRVLRSPLPTVAAVNGPAVGAGFNLALACDVRICSPAARFDARFLRLGLHPGGGHTWLLERAVGPQVAAAVVLFGARVDGEDAVRRGLAWQCVPDADLLATAIEFSSHAAVPPAPLARRTKATLRAVPWQPDFESALATEVAQQMWSMTHTRSIGNSP